MRYVLRLRLAIFIILFSFAPYLLTILLEQDQKFGLFDWLESPSYSPFFGVLGAAFGVSIWLTTRKLIAGKSVSDQPLRKTVYWGITIAWLINWILIGLLLFEHPPAPVSSTHEVKVLDLTTPAGQSKPIEHHLIVQSWREKRVETLSTTSYANAEKMLTVGRIEVSIGKDWLGRIRVLHVKPIYIDE